MPSTSHHPLSRELLRVIDEAIRQGVADALRAARPAFAQSGAQLPEFFTIAETMAVLPVSRSGLYRLFDQKKLTLVKDGRRSLVSSVEVAAFAERLRAAARKGGSDV